MLCFLFQNKIRTFYGNFTTFLGEFTIEGVIVALECVNFDLDHQKWGKSFKFRLLLWVRPAAGAFSTFLSTLLFVARTQKKLSAVSRD